MDESKTKNKQHVRNGSLFNEIMQFRSEHWEEFVEEFNLSAKRKASYSRRETYENMVTVRANSMADVSKTCDGVAKVLNFPDNSDISIDKNDKRLIPELKLNFSKQIEEKAEILLEKNGEQEKNPINQDSANNKQVLNNNIVHTTNGNIHNAHERPFIPRLSFGEPRALRHNGSLSSLGVGPSTVNPNNEEAASSPPLEKATKTIKNSQNIEKKEREIYERNRRNTYEVRHIIF